MKRGCHNNQSANQSDKSEDFTKGSKPSQRPDQEVKPGFVSSSTNQKLSVLYFKKITLVLLVTRGSKKKITKKGLKTKIKKKKSLIVWQKFLK